MRTADIHPVVASPTSPVVTPAQRGAISARTGVIKIVAFFALSLVLLLGVDRLVNAGLRRMTVSSFGVTNRIVRGEIDAELLITGSSRALTHYDPRILERVTGLASYNIGINGSQTDMQVAMLRTYLAHNHAPKILIHNLDLFAFQTTKEIYDPAQYLPYLREPDLYAAIRRIHGDAWKWRWLPLYGYATQDLRFTWLLGLRAWVGAPPRETHFQGFTPRHTDWTGDFEAYRDAHPGGVVVEVEQAGVEALEDVARLARSAGSTLVLVYSPEYHEMQAMERNRAEILERFRAIASRHGARVWDFSDSDLSRSRRYFYNSQHLNAQGAEEFSRALADRLVSSGVLAGTSVARAAH